MSTRPTTSNPVPLVLHVIPTAVARGAQREARALVDRLERPTVRHHRLLSIFAGADEVPVDEALGYDGGERQSAGFDPRVALGLRRALGRLDPAVLVAHGGDPLKYLVPAMAGRSRPLAYYATGTFGHAHRGAKVALWRALVRRADVVAAEGEEVLAECRDLLGVPSERLVLAPNGRDPDEFFPLAGSGPGAAPAGGRVPVVAFVGALTTGKRPDFFIDVVAALRRQRLEFRAVLCGDGPLAPEVAGPASAAGVELLGSRHDVAEIMRGADVFVFTSRPTGEGMPGVLIEAGLSGLAAVATAVPGVGSIVDDGTTGFVVDPDDHDGVVRATARLIAEPELRRDMGEAARRRCTERFSLDVVTACWVSFLEPLVARSARSTAARTSPGIPPDPTA